MGTITVGGLSASLPAVSGSQLQPEEPDAETEEDTSVTERPSGEVIRPRPQGSSPVYECPAEGAGFRVQKDTPSRRGSSGRRTSWWKRGSGDAQTFSTMSHPESVQEAMEVMFKTEVEAGASGYSVTGGGDQGIFVKQVLKDSSAAKLFSLREGDQLLSATIFFDDIKYEDALKILQYSEPYKVQFQIKRQLHAAKDQQDKEAAERCAEIPTKALEEDGDRERLIAKPREARGRRPRERLSWPKFQGMKGKQGPGPRRSHSSSEAYERGGAREVSPTSTDTEFQFPAEDWEQKAGTGGQRRRRRFLNLRFKMGSRPERTATGYLDREALGGLETGSMLEEKPEDTGTTPSGRSQEKVRMQEARQALTTQQATELSFTGKGEQDTARPQRKMKQLKAREEITTYIKARALPAPGGSKDQEWEESLENGFMTMSPQDTTVTAGTQEKSQEIQVRIHELKIPKFTFPGEKVQEIGEEIGEKIGGLQQTRPVTFTAQDGHKAEKEAETNGQQAQQQTVPGEEKHEISKLRGKQRDEGEETQKEWGKEKTKLPMTKSPEFGWSEKKEGTTERRKDTTGKQKQKITYREKEETSKSRRVDLQGLEVDIKGVTPEMKGSKHEVGTSQVSLASMEVDAQAAGGKLESVEAAKDSKFKMPKFKMPSFGISTSAKSTKASLEVSTPKLETDVILPTIQSELKMPEVSAQLPCPEVDLQASQVEMKLPEDELTTRGGGLKGQVPKVQIGSIKMPKVDLKSPQVNIKGPRVELKGPKGKVGDPELEVSLPSEEVDIQAAGGKLEGEVEAKESKFKIPKFKMPSFGMSATGKMLESSLEVSTPKLEADMDLPTIQGEVKTPEVSIQLPSTDTDLQASQGGVKVPKAELSTRHPDLKGHLHKVHMPSIEMPKVDLKGPQMDIKGHRVDMKGPKGEVGDSEVEVAPPNLEVVVQASSKKLQGEVEAEDSKFKMPSFGVSTTDKTLKALHEAPTPKLEANVDQLAIQGEVKTPEVSIQLPSTDMDLQASQGGVKMPEAELSMGVPGLKGQLHKVHMPSIKMPKVDLKGPQVDIKGPSMDLKGATGEVRAPEVDVSLPSMQVDVQPAGGKFEGNLGAKESKFKMPKFKMPSFGMSAPGKTLEASLEVSKPKPEADVDLPAIEGEVETPEVGIQLPSTNVDLHRGQVGVKLPKAELCTGHPGLKGHLPKVQILTMKIPKVDLKGPQVDIKGPRVDLKGAKGEVGAPEVDLSLLSIQTDIQASGGKPEDFGAKESKFKMPKFKMPSFTMSATDKILKSSLEVSKPKLEHDVDLPAIQSEVKTTEVSIQLPSTDMGLQASQVSVKMPEAELSTGGPGLKGQLPKVPMPSIKMSKVDLKGPQVDIKGPRVELKGPKGEVGDPDLEVSLPSAGVDLQAAGGKLQGEVEAKDSKFKMPKFKMPSFDLSEPSKPSEASLEVSTLSLEADVELPAIQGDIKTPEVSIQLPSTNMDLQASQVDVKIPEVQLSMGGPVLKGHLPKDEMLKVDPKGLQVNIKGLRADLKGPKDEVGVPELEVSMPCLEVDIQAASGKLEGEVEAKHSKFKLPKFKMPYSGQSPPGKSLEASLEVSTPKLEADMVLPIIQSEVKTPEVSIQLPSTDVDQQSGQVGMKLPKAQLPTGHSGLKGHLPKVQIPTMKIPKVDLKGPQLDIKGTRVELKGAKGEVGTPEVDMSLPSAQMDVQAAGGKPEEHLEAKDSKFKMSKFKMPCFDVSTTDKTLEASHEVSMPKLEADVDLPAIQSDAKTPEVSIQLPSTDMDLQASQGGVKVPKAELPTRHPDLKGQLPNVHMPSIKMSKVDLKGLQVGIKSPRVDLKGTNGDVGSPEVDVSLPSIQVDVQAAGSKPDGDFGAKESKFKMPSISMLAPGKSLESLLEVSTPKLEADVDLPTIQGDAKTPEVSIQLPSMNMDVQDSQVGMKLPEAELPTGHPGLKGQLPKVHMLRIKMPKVDLKGPQVDIKGPSVDLKGANSDVGAPEVDMSLPSVQVDVQASGSKLEGDLGSKESKFKMPNFKIPSFGVLAPSKSLESSLEVSTLKLEADVDLPAIQGDAKTPEVSIQLPSHDMDLQATQLSMKLPEAEMPIGHSGLKGHLPKETMPKVDLKGPQVDIKGPRVNLRGPKGDMRVPKLEVLLPTVEADIESAGGKLEGEVEAEDSKFKMSFFGMSAPENTIESSLEVSSPKLENDVDIPTIEGDVKTPEVSIQFPSTNMDLQAGQVGVKLPEAELPPGHPDLKGQLPKVQMPSIKMTKVDLKGPEVDIKGTSVDLKRPKGEVRASEMDVSLARIEVDVQASGGKLEGDLGAKDSRFKMPKFKMPSFGQSAPSKSLEASLEVSTPKLVADVVLPTIQSEFKTPEVNIQLPSTDVDQQSGQVGMKLPEAQPSTRHPGLKGHLPKVQIPTMKIPKVDLKGPQLDIKGPRVELKGAKGEVGTPEVDVSLPCVQMDVQAAGGRLEEHLAGKDSKFKMPKIKMRSFGMSTTDKTLEALHEVSMPKLEANVDLPAIQGDVKTPEVSLELPSTNMDLQASQGGVKTPEAELSMGGPGLKGQLHKVHVPGIKMPKVDLKGPQMDVKGPRVEMKGPKGEVGDPDLEVSLPSGEVDIQASGIKLEGEVEAKESKLKMPKFKMPSFGVLVPGKMLESSLEVSTLKLEADMDLPSIQGEVKNPEVSIQLPSTDMDLQASQGCVKVPMAELPTRHPDLKGQLLKVHMHSIKMPKVELKGPQVDIKSPSLDLKGAKGDVGSPEVDVSLPIIQADVQAAGSKLEGDFGAKESKFKMPKYKMPSISMSVPGKSLESSLEVSTTNLEADMDLPTIQGDAKTPEVSIQLPSTDMDLQDSQVGMKLPESELSTRHPGLKGQLPKVPIPTMKIPKVDLKGPQVDIKGPRVDLKGAKGDVGAPEVDVSLPSIQVDVQASGGKLEGDLGSKESKFKMPKFKMPSFGVSAPGKSLESSLEVSTPKLEADVDLPTIQSDVKNPEIHIQLPSHDMDLQATQVSMKLPEAELSTGHPGLKGHLPKEEMPKVDLKGPKVDIKGPRLDLRGLTGDVGIPELEVSLPTVEVVIEAAGGKLEGEVEAKDSKFKMPKFKMPSFGMSAPENAIESSLDLSLPKLENDMDIPTIEGDGKTPEVSIQLPSTNMDLQDGQVGVKLTEAELPPGHPDLKGQLSKVQMPSIKMTNVDLKGPEVDIKGTSVDLKRPKGEVRAPELDVSLARIEVDVQASGGKLEGDLGAKDSRFKMPKFKMPSFGQSAPGKSLEASLEVSTPKLEADVVLPTIQSEVKTPEVNIQLPSTDVDQQSGQVGMKLPKAQLPTWHPGLKGHLPKVQIPTMKIPKVDLKGPQLDIKGPRVELKGAKGEMGTSKVDMSLPSVQMDVQTSGGKPEEDLGAKDSKFKMLNFKMPSFGMSTDKTLDKTLEALHEVSMPKLEANVDLPAIQGDVKTPEVSIELPSTNMDLRASQGGVKMPKAELSMGGPGLKGQLPKVHMPSIKMPKVDLKGPQADIKGPRVELRGLKGEVGYPELEVSLLSTGVDIQAAGIKLEGEVEAKESMFNMPKFKMPSFGMSAPKNTIESSLEVFSSKLENDVDIPTIQSDVKTPEVSIQLPSTNMNLQAGQVGVKLPEAELPLGHPDLKGQMSKVQMPSIKKTQVDLMGQQVDIKGTSVDLKRPKGEVRAPEIDVSLPCVEVDFKASGGKLEGVLGAKDSRFKMPKFKMPSFGQSAPSKSLETSLEVSTPKLEADVVLPTIQSEFKTPEVNIQLPSTDVDQQSGQVGMKLPEAQLPTGHPGLKGLLPKVQIPTMKIPKVDLKGPQLDIKDPRVELKGAKGEVGTPEVDMSLPSVQMDAQAAGGKPEEDLGAKDSKFKMPKFKMLSFGVSTTEKTLEASHEVSTPKLEAKLDLPTIQGDVKTPEVSIELPSTDMDMQASQGCVKMPQADLSIGGPGLKAQLPKVHMPSIKMPKVDLKGPQVDVKGPRVEMKGPKGEVGDPDLEVSLPSAEVDIQAASVKLEGEVEAKESKFKIPKFKMPSFGMSVTGKMLESSLEVSTPKLEADVDVPAIQGEMKTPEVSIQLPSHDMDPQASQVGMKLPEAELPAGHPGLKGNLPKEEMSKMNLKGLQVDIKGPRVNLKGLKGDLRVPELEVSLPNVEVDIQSAGSNLVGDLEAQDNKFKMPSFGMSALGKTIESSLEVSLPKLEADVDLPAIEGDLKTCEVSIQLPSTDKNLQAGQVGMKLPEAELPTGHPGLKEHVPREEMPSIKMCKVDLKGPQVDIKGPSVDLKGAKGDVRAAELDVSLLSVQADIQASGGKPEDVGAKDSNFKMPKLKMPSFAMSATGKTLKSSLEVSTPKLEAEVDLPTIQGEVKIPEVSIQLPSTDMDLQASQVDIKMPEAELSMGAPGVKGQLRKVHMPIIKMPKVDLKGPKVDIKGPSMDLKGAKGDMGAPELDVSLPCIHMDIQATGSKLEGDLGAKYKFKMPQFKMPSFGMSAPGKTTESSLEVSSPKLEADVYIPAIQGEVKTPEVSIQLPSTDMDLQGGQVSVKLPTAELPTGHPGLKGKLPKVHMPKIKMPKVDLKGPQVDIKGPSMDLKGAKCDMRAPEVDISLPSMKMDVQASGSKLEGDLEAKDSKFKMPKFKMPSFDMSAPSKTLEASLEVSTPKLEAHVVLPSIQSEVKIPEVSIQLPSTDVDLHSGQVDMNLPKTELPTRHPGLKGHLPKVQIPTMKIPKVDLKGPQLDIKGPRVDMKGAKGEVGTPEVDMSLPSVQMDVQTSGGKPEGDLKAKDSKFKMPKFKMPSFAMSTTGKTLESSLEISIPKLEQDVDLPVIQGELKTPEVSIQLPYTDMDLQASQGGVKMPKAELSTGVPGLKGQLPKMHMPSIKFPQVDLKGPQVDIKGPSMDLKGAKVDVGAPGVDMSLPSVQVDVQAAGSKLEGDLGAKESKFKMPKFTMPSFGVSAPSKSLLDISTPKLEADMDLPTIQGDAKTPEVSIQLPSHDMDLQAAQLSMKLPAAELPTGHPGLKGHLPKEKMPKVHLKGPQVNIKGPRVDLSGPKVDVGVPEIEVSLPTVEVDVEATSDKLEGEVEAKDSKFKMPKFKMPSFGMSTPRKTIESSLEVSLPKLKADMDLPAIKDDLKTPEVSIQLPSTNMDLQASQVGVKLPEAELPIGHPGLKGLLPKVHMPRIKMPKVHLKGPQVDIKGPSMDLKGAKGDIGAPELDVSLPSVQVDVQTSGGKPEEDLGAKDSNFKMPKFKIPSFGMSAPGKSLESTLEVSTPKLEGDVHLPTIQGEVKTPEVNIQLPSTDMDLQASQVGLKMPKAELSMGGPGLKGQLPKVHMPSIKMPSVDLKGPQMDIKGPRRGVKDTTSEVGTHKLEVSLSTAEVDVQAASGKLEEGEVEAKESKFKMPKFKMPSFTLSATSKTLEASLEVSTPKLEADMALPAIQGDMKTTDIGVSLPAVNVDLQANQLCVKLPEAELPTEGTDLKGHLPKVHMPSIKLPRVDLKGPQVDIKVPSVDLKGPKGEVGTPELEVSLASAELDVQAASGRLEGEIEAKDSKLKMSKFKMPSFGMLAPGNTIESSLEVFSPKLEADVDIPAIEGDVKTPEVGIQLPSMNMDLQDSQVGVQLPEAELPTGHPGLKGQLPKVHVPSIKMPKVDLKGPQVDIKVPRRDLKGSKGEVSTAELEESLPSVEMDVQAAASKLEGEVRAKESKFKMPQFKMPSFGMSAPTKTLEASLEVSMPKFEADVVLPAVEGDMKTPEVIIQLPSTEQGPHTIPPSQHSYPKGPLSPMVQSHVTFPTFHRPRFVVSMPLTVAPEDDSGSTEHGPISLLSQEPRQDCSAPAAKVSQLPLSQPSPTAVPVSLVVPELLGPSTGRAAAGGAEQEGRGSPSKTPRFKLPLFSWSPKKEARPMGDSMCLLEDPTDSLALGLDHEDSHPGDQDAQVEAHMALPAEKTSDLGSTRKAGFALRRLVLPKLKSSKGSAGLRPQEDEDTVLSSSTAAGDCGAIERGGSEGSIGSTGFPGGPQEARDVALQLPQTPASSVGSVKMDLRSFPAEQGASQCDVDPGCDWAMGGGSKGLGLRGSSARKPQGEGIAPTTEGPLKAPLGHTDRVPSLNSPEEAPTTGEPTADSQERWFRMPRLRVPGFRRLSSKEQGEAQGQDVAQVHLPVAAVPAEAPAATGVPVFCVPGSEVEASVFLQPVDTEVTVTAPGTASYADVLKRDRDRWALKLHPPSVKLSGGDQPHSKGQVCAVEGSLPCQKPIGRPSEAQAPAAEWCKVKDRAELQTCQPEGPVPLRVSSTDVPSQDSVLDTRQLWEDSVLTVTFPKLRVPRFSFPAPGAETAMFFPVVKDICQEEVGADPGLGLWGSSILRAGPGDPGEQPVGPSHPLEGSPVSTVKVHIQEAQAKSLEVVVCSPVMQERVQCLVPEAFSTQRVRELEIPASPVQMPSYGFSLLKLKTPGPPAQAPGSGAQEGSAAPRADSCPEDSTPDATEPFEVISGSTSLPGLQTLRSDDPARPPPAGSGSDPDEEPAEILEFLPEDSVEASAQLVAEDKAPKGRPEGKKPSGLLWSWLPNIGFSPVSETIADSRDDTQRSVPVLTQPGPQPDLEPPKRQERVGWFRFPKLGFSSLPTKKTKSTEEEEEEAALAEQKLQEESVTFFDARESFSPEEEEEGQPAMRAPGTTDMVASLARTELILLEPDTPADEESAPRPTSK
ncbi:Protein AHNAK2 [Fukomys damarensis]|uniref:Protein AHNAK2 n=2 Tax=Fukomys damarensis TaxID=885580 RepID=A0A091CUY1_FUKDA|nr:Protein AHNAK2 [Fukomys damarensis]